MNLGGAGRVASLVLRGGDPLETGSGERKSRIIRAWRVQEGLRLSLKSVCVIGSVSAAALMSREFTSALGFRLTWLTSHGFYFLISVEVHT